MNNDIPNMINNWCTTYFRSARRMTRGLVKVTLVTLTTVIGQAFKMIATALMIFISMPINAEEVTLELESTLVGDKEQPAVSYFIPWKEIGAPDQLNWNIELKHDQSLKVIDREILLRSDRIYNDLKMEESR